MPEQNIEEAAETVEVEEVEADADETSPEDDEKADDWRSNFDPERARDKIRKQNSELKNLRDRAKAAEQKAAGSEEKDQRIGALEATALRYEVALDLGMPKELASRLQGTTREEMLADAEALLNLVSDSKRPPTKRPAENLRSAGEPEREPEETDTRKIGDRIFGR